jgi:hypothetical protein
VKVWVVVEVVLSQIHQLERVEEVEVAVEVAQHRMYCCFVRIGGEVVEVVEVEVGLKLLLENSKLKLGVMVG